MRKNKQQLEHDEIFKNVFTNKKIFIQFLQNYVHTDWAYDIAEDDILMMNTEFANIKYPNRESDILYKLRLNGNTEMWIYLLLEHQSKVDFLMVYRILEYMVEIWRMEIKSNPRKSRRKDYLLSPIYPIVFYDGLYKWTAEIEFSKKIRNYKQYNEFLPNFRYHLIDLTQIELEQLESYQDILSIIMALDKIRDEEGLEKLLNFGEKYWQAIEKNIRLEGSNIELILKVMLGQFILNAGITETEAKPILDKIENKEVKNMLTAVKTTFKNKLKKAEEKGIEYGITIGEKKGIEKGIEKGMEKGEKIGKIEIIHDLYEYKYGPYEEISKYIDEINSVDELQKIFNIILKSQNKEEILNYLNNKNTE